METVRIAGIDPGLRFTGYGIVNYDTDTNEIWASNCGIVKNKSSQYIKGLDAVLHMRQLLSELTARECFSECDKIIIECPAAIYSKNFSSGGLLPVATIAGCLLALFPAEKTLPVYPSTWNSRKKKDVTHAITEEFVGSHEDWNYDFLPKAQGQFEHIIDAVSMALWYMKLNYLEEPEG